MFSVAARSTFFLGGMVIKYVRNMVVFNVGKACIDFETDCASRDYEINSFRIQYGTVGTRTHAHMSVRYVI